MGFDIEPRKIYKHSFSSRESGIFPKAIVLHKLADTWDESLAKAKRLYLECGMMLTYFSPSDIGFLQFKEAYSRDYRGLGYGDASGTLYYRVKGFTETKEQSVPLVVIVSINGDKCPHPPGVLVPHGIGMGY